MDVKYVLAAVACGVAISLAVNGLTSFGTGRCDIDVTTTQSLAVGLEAASARGCTEVTVRRHQSDGTMETVTAVLPSPETVVALREISKKTRELSVENINLDEDTDEPPGMLTGSESLH